MSVFLRLIAIVIAASTGAFFCGCESLIKPTAQERHESFLRLQSQFTANQDAALRQTYFIICIKPDQKLTLDPQTGTLKLSSAAAPVRWSQGLAVALDPDGYLLTAGHVVDDESEKHFVLGWFGGKTDLKQARVVYLSASKAHADVALLKVDGKPDYQAVFDDRPQVGAPAFGVVNFWQQTEPGGTLSFAAGKVLQITRDPGGSAVELLDTTLPCWHGDSGGPLLSSDGRLIGVTTGYVAQWNLFSHDVHQISFYPDRPLIEKVIARDRTLHESTRADAGVLASLSKSVQR